MRIEWLDKALDDFDAAMSCIAERSPDAARQVALAIYRQVGHLRQNPFIGRPGRVPGSRELVVSGTHFIIPYRFDGRELIELLAVMHDAREWPEKFGV